MCQFYDKAKIIKLFECISTNPLIFRIFDSVYSPFAAACGIARDMLYGRI
ncbi:hypothetical protein HMPREF3034_00340 [Prevotella sp. DNF00663]|nr:hypothetical protein HMPREF3034_00340 [Prevotella sp. DNF00663]